MMLGVREEGWSVSARSCWLLHKQCKVSSVLSMSIQLLAVSGDALFFHCNLLHTSSANTSPDRRWAFLCAYNRRSNDPVLPHHHPQYTPLDIVSFSLCGRQLGGGVRGGDLDGCEGVVDECVCPVTLR